MDFHTLYQRYAPAVRRFALFLSGNPAVADDLTSETFVRAWTSSGAIRESTVKAYLFTIARNLYLDLLRHDRRRAELDESLPDPRPGLATQVEDATQLASVLEAMRELPEVDRAALLMRASEEMSYQEIAEALDLPLSTVKVKVHRARLKLMKRCAPAANAGEGEAI